MLSIIIPAYNEEKQLPDLLRHLEVASSGNVAEIIVVDGGSSDNTANIAKDHPKVFYVTSEKGRAVQMNTGAKLAKGEILYFLHADSFPPKEFDSLIVNQVENGKKAGCFQMKFDKDHWWLKLMGYFTKVNHISCRGGDQSLFVEKNLFEEIGGFDESYKVYEDNEIIKRLYDKKQFSIIKSWITTSARLYNRMGVWNTQWLFIEIYWKRRRGASAEELYSHYYKRLNS
ncbi:TIGR04283 family arsenosugar biosynthesis glycosyltransferase [Christiangramia sp. SM2212]|uniref:TIGR04283 family arsenosugar biosynthesis glycosyltransferase n=1 Tax=Christiangramia sediminicola TaxID=3073267 RepID=A0ABU1ELI9_9FLAO|nr:TIGR04283 family arsenosugar biosynthesis glycosyltransferase [Christiangramia sp. SM2212]MDR5589199.1 TIGR04283 family arsenosugar biosynthesis glycosyltransferase [Christiangramia sp. SM2212]